MGYAKTITYSTLVTASSSGTTTTVTTGNNNFNCGTLTTPDYKDPLAAAYVEVHVNSRLDNSGGNNWLVNTNSPYIGLNPGTTFNCGTIPSNELWTLANTFVGSPYIIYGRTNIASNLDPGTAYTCQLMHTTSQADSLLLFNCQFILRMYFNV